MLSLVLMSTIMIADGNVHPCFRFFWAAFATLEGGYRFIFSYLLLPYV